MKTNNQKSKTMKRGNTTVRALAKKVVSKKKTVKKPVEKIISETSWYKEVETTETTVVKKVKDIREVPTGTYYTVEIDGVLVAGVIFNQNGEDDWSDNTIYLLNNVCGEEIPDDIPSLGYLYCIDIDNSWSYIVNMETLRFPTPPSNFELPQIPEKIAGYYPNIMTGKVKFGCEYVTNEQIETLYNNLKY